MSLRDLALVFFLALFAGLGCTTPTYQRSDGPAAEPVIRPDAGSLSDRPGDQAVTDGAADASLPGAKDAPVDDAAPDAPEKSDAAVDAGDAGGVGRDASFDSAPATGTGGNPGAHDAGSSDGASDGRMADARLPSATISIDFAGTSTRLEPSEMAGVLPSANWNEAGASTSSNDGSHGTLTGLLASDGTATGASVSWVATDSAVSSVVSTASADLRMMRTYLRYCYAVSERADAGSAALTITVSSLPEPFLSRGYDLIVYTLQEVPADDPRSWSVSAASARPVTVSAAASDPVFDGVYKPVVDGVGQYIRFTGLSGSAVTIKATPVTAVRYDCAAVSGIQLVSR
jgi:hypothetical protein